MVVLRTYLLEEETVQVHTVEGIVSLFAMCTLTHTPSLGCKYRVTLQLCEASNQFFFMKLKRRLSPSVRILIKSQLPFHFNCSEVFCTLEHICSDTLTCT